MRQAIVISLTVVLFGCLNRKPIDSENDLFCSNEIELISNRDLEYLPSIDLYNLNNNIDSKISKIVDSLGIVTNQNIEFNASINNIEGKSFNIIIKYYYHPPNIPITHTITIRNQPILLNREGNIYLGEDLVEIDSLANKVFQHYSKIGDDDYITSIIHSGLIASWDAGVSQDKFRLFVEKIIEGYLKFVNEKAHDIFKLEVCELNHEAVQFLKKEYPFYIRIAELKYIDEL